MDISSEEFALSRDLKLFVPTNEWLGLHISSLLENLWSYLEYFQTGEYIEKFNYTEYRNFWTVEKEGLLYHISKPGNRKGAKIDHIEVYRAVKNTAGVNETLIAITACLGHPRGLEIVCGPSFMTYNRSKTSEIKITEAVVVYGRDSDNRSYNYRFKLHVEDAIITSARPMFSTSFNSSVVGGLFEHVPGQKFVPSEMFETVKQFATDHML